jgi:DNA polymerase-1
LILQDLPIDLDPLDIGSLSFEILTLRSFFKAKEGYKLVIADYSQQDLRDIAGLASDLRTIETFKEGRDLYLQIAQEITGKPEEECREFREMAKIIVLGLINGMSDWKIPGC